MIVRGGKEVDVRVTKSVMLVTAHMMLMRKMMMSHHVAVGQCMFYMIFRPAVCHHVLNFYMHLYIESVKV